MDLAHHIDASVKLCLKRLHLSRAIVDTLKNAIFCIAVGLRASHLLDVAHWKPDVAKQFLHGLRNHPECKGLVMLQFKDRYTFLCHKQRLQEHLDSNSKCPPYFIDIQGNQPAQRDQPPHLQEWLGIKLLPFLSSDETYFFMPFVPPYMVALTGWMLEYPVIYVSHVDQDDPNVELDEWEPRTNCLGGQPLQVIGVWLHNNHSPLSKDYKLLSFSYPQDVIHSSDHRLSIETALEHKMRRRLQDQNHRPCLQSTALELEKTSTVLDRVAL